jgi:hypothetical protein
MTFPLASTTSVTTAHVPPVQRDAMIKLPIVKTKNFNIEVYLLFDATQKPRLCVMG